MATTSSCRPFYRINRISSHIKQKQLLRRPTVARFLSSQAEDDVLFEDRKYGNVLITLNRQKALNALDGSMVMKLTPKYQAWVNEADKSPRTIVMKGAGGKAFCAGGDIKAIYDSKKQGLPPRECCAFFNDEYVLNQLIGNLPETLPQVAILNGITMGEVLASLCTVRIPKWEVPCSNRQHYVCDAGNCNRFFCDVGGSYFLPRLKRNLGTYLALTGARLVGPEVALAGIATHFVKSESLLDFENELLSSPYTEIENILTRFSVPSSELQEMPESKALWERLDPIERCFGHASVEDIIESLEKESSQEFASMCLKLLKKMSPTSLKVVLRQMQEGAKRDFTQCFKMELLMSERFMERDDFFEGVRALLVDKDKSPKWNPPTLQEVSEEDVSAFFK